MRAKCEDNEDVIMVKINNTTTSTLVDSSAYSTVLGKKQFDNLMRDGPKGKLRPEEIYECMGMSIYRLWVNSRQVFSVKEGKLWKLFL